MRMAGKMLENYLRLQDLIRVDPEYRVLLEEYRVWNEPVIGLIARLPKDEAAVLMEYIGACGALGTRMMEIVCSEMEFPEEYPDGK